MLKRVRTIAVVVILNVIAVVAGLYGAEAYFTYETWWNELGTADRIKEAAIKAGGNWDTREKAQVIADLRKQGKDAFPTFAPSLYLDDNGIDYKGQKWFLFSGVSNSWNVFCQEMGPWSVYLSDEHGFNNTKGLYIPDKLDVAIVGDSFAHGACLPPGKDVAGLLRSDGYRALNVGIGGTGPLIYLAVQREYIKPLRPKKVFWLFYAVDIRDVVYENVAPTLRRYVDDPNFSQGLINRQSEVDTFLRSFLEKEYEQRLEKLQTSRQERAKVIRSRLIDEWLHLARVKERISQLGGREAVYEGREAEKLALMEKVVNRARNEVQSWGGEFIFVYLPDWYFYAREYDSYGIKIDANFLLRQDVLKRVHAMNIPVIDVQGEIFDKNPDPLSLYNWRMYGHYTPQGYKLIEERLLDYMRSKTN